MKEKKKQGQTITIDARAVALRVLQLPSFQQCTSSTPSSSHRSHPLPPYTFLVMDHDVPHQHRLQSRVNESLELPTGDLV